MTLAAIHHGKKLFQSMFVHYGYRVVKLDQYSPRAADRTNSASLLKEILPVVQHNAATGKWPSPGFIQDYFNPRRLAMTRLLLEQCDTEGIELDGRKVLDIGCHAGSLLRLMRARYPGAVLSGCDINDTKLAMAQRACPDAKLSFCSLSDLPAHADQDVVFLMEVLEHTVDPEGTVRRLIDFVGPTGTLVLTVPDGREDRLPAKEFHSEFGSYAGHINFWSPESWKYFLARTVPERTLKTRKLPTGHLFAALMPIRPS